MITVYRKKAPITIELSDEEAKELILVIVDSVEEWDEGIPDAVVDIGKKLQELLQ